MQQNDKINYSTSLLHRAEKIDNADDEHILD